MQVKLVRGQRVISMTQTERNQCAIVRFLMKEMAHYKHVDAKDLLAKFDDLMGPVEKREVMDVAA